MEELIADIDRLIVSALSPWNHPGFFAYSPLSLVCFRARPPRHGESDYACVDHLNEQIMHAVNATGEAFLSHTKLNDRFTLRLAVGNIRTTETHVARAWQLLRDACERLDPADGV